MNRYPSSSQIFRWGKELLGREGVVGLALLVGGLAGEGDDEDAEDISVLGLDVLNGLDEGLSLLDEGAELIASDVDSVEAGNGLPALGLVDDQLDLPPVEAVLVGGEVCLHGAKKDWLKKRLI